MYDHMYDGILLPRQLKTPSNVAKRKRQESWEYIISELTKEPCVSILQGFTGLAIIAWQARLTPATQRNMVCLDYL